MEVSRKAKDALLRLADQFPVVGITGPRQSGKTTLAKMTFPDKKYVSLDDKELRSLAASNPDLVKEWDYDKNAPLTPDNIARAAKKKVWWKCAKGHSWEASINNRTSNGRGCPYCAGKKVLCGFNDLGTVIFNIPSLNLASILS